MDCDVAAAFDHVSHHGVSEATLAMEVPPVLVAAWIQRVQELRDDCEARRYWDLKIRRTRSVLQGDPCAADLFWSSSGQVCRKVL